MIIAKYFIIFLLCVLIFAIIYEYNLSPYYFDIYQNVTNDFMYSEDGTTFFIYTEVFLCKRHTTNSYTKCFYHNSEFTSNINNIDSLKQIEYNKARLKLEELEKKYTFY